MTVADPAVHRSATPPPGWLQEVRGWSDARFGPIREMMRFRLAAPEPAWWVSMCTLARAPTGAWRGEARAGAAGTSIDPDVAEMRAAGELLERYSALNAPLAGELMPPDVDGLLARFPRCGEQEPCPRSFQAIDPDVALTHVSVERLADGKAVWIPAGFVHLGFWPQPPEPPVAMPISTGLAFHPTLEGALWNGLCEVAERDAMMLTWWLRCPARQIDCSEGAVPEPLADRLQRIAAVGLRAALFDITTDFRVPTVFCVLAGEHYPHAVIGAACRADPLSACTKALDEAVSARVALRGSAGFVPPSLERFDWVERLDHHSLLYAHGGLDHALDFLCSSARAPIAFTRFAAGPWWEKPRDRAALQALASEAAGAHGWTIFWADVTAPEAARLGHVVKVVVPEMVPLSQSHSARWLATPRLTRGLPPGGAFNPFPHPFA